MTTTDLSDRIDAILEDIDVPEGMTLSHEIVGDDEDWFVVVSLTVPRNSPLGLDAWEEAEEAVDLSSLGLEFYDSGPSGSALVDGREVTGTWQHWVG